MERFSKLIFVLNTCLTTFPTNIIIRIKIRQLALMAAYSGYFLLNHIADIDPMIWLICREVIDVFHTMSSDAIRQLFRKVPKPTCIDQCVLSTHTNSPVVWMHIVPFPGVEGKYHIWTPLTYNNHQLTS